MDLKTLAVAWKRRGQGDLLNHVLNETDVPLSLVTFLLDNPLEEAELKEAQHLVEFPELTLDKASPISFVSESFGELTISGHLDDELLELVSLLTNKSKEDLAEGVIRYHMYDLRGDSLSLDIEELELLESVDQKSVEVPNLSPGFEAVTSLFDSQGEGESLEAFGAEIQEREKAQEDETAQETEEAKEAQEVEVAQETEAAEAAKEAQKVEAAQETKETEEVQETEEGQEEKDLSSLLAADIEESIQDEMGSQDESLEIENEETRENTLDVRELENQGLGYDLELVDPEVEAAVDTSLASIEPLAIAESDENISSDKEEDAYFDEDDPYEVAAEDMTEDDIEEVRGIVKDIYNGFVRNIQERELDQRLGLQVTELA